jgi:hypothetical protein
MVNFLMVKLKDKELIFGIMALNIEVLCHII